MTSSVEWRWLSWRELDADRLHAILKLRCDVFVVEQNCAYPDIDGFDPVSEHLCGTDAANRLVAYLRLMPPGSKCEEPAIGRVVVPADSRKLGLARRAMLEAIRRSGSRFPGQPVFLQAQAYLQRFYGSLGFAAIGASYLEDGIPHVDMLRR